MDPLFELDGSHEASVFILVLREEERVLFRPAIGVGRIDDSDLMLLVPLALRTVIELEVDTGSGRCHDS